MLIKLIWIIISCRKSNHYALSCKLYVNYISKKKTEIKNTNSIGKLKKI